jgi:hypothetical protein
MLDTMKYVNHLGEIVQFGTNYYANHNDLRNYEWSYSTEFGRIVNLRRSVAKKTIPFFIKASSDEAAIELKNRFFSITEKDVISGEKGRFYIGEYYFSCFVTASKKSDYLADKTHLVVSIDVASDRPVWTREIVTLYQHNAAASPEEAAIQSRDYEYDYPYDYADAGSTGFASSISNPHFAPVDFIAVIGGGSGITAPEIIIGATPHKFTHTIPAGGYVTLNTREKTLVATSLDGTKTNIFSKRDKASDIFAKIPSGMSGISWNGAFDFELTQLIERSEPEWT